MKQENKRIAVEEIPEQKKGIGESKAGRMMKDMKKRKQTGAEAEQLQDEGEREETKSQNSDDEF